MSVYKKIKDAGLLPQNVVVTTALIEAAGGKVIPEFTGRKKTPTGFYFVEFDGKRSEEATQLPFSVYWSLEKSDGQTALMVSNSSASSYRTWLMIAEKLKLLEVIVALPFTVFGDLPVPSYAWGYTDDGVGLTMAAQAASLPADEAKAAVLDYIQQVVKMGVVSAEEIVAALQAATA